MGLLDELEVLGLLDELEILGLLDELVVLDLLDELEVLGLLDELEVLGLLDELEALLELLDVLSVGCGVYFVISIDEILPLPLTLDLILKCSEVARPSE